MGGDFTCTDPPPGSTCHVTDYSSEHGDVAACVPDEGLIILRKGRVIGWCDIGEGCVQRISIFFTYQPLVKNYVLQLASSVKVVSHSSCLKVTHTFENVTRFEIGDFSHKGFPQLGLWGVDSNMRVTDLTASCSSSLANSNPVETVLSSKLRGLKVSVERVRKQLEEKKKLRRHCMFHIVGLDQPNASPALDKLIPLIGSSSSSTEVSKTTSRCPIIIKKSWQKLLDRKWILGCDVQNNSSRPLRALSLCVSSSGAGATGDAARTVEWRVMVQRPPRPRRAGSSHADDGDDGGDDPLRGATAPWPPWTVLAADGVLEGGQHAVIVATVPEPSFLGRSAVVEVLGLVSAVLPDGREAWTALPAWRLSVDAVLRGDLVPFGVSEAAVDRDRGHEDVLASAACCPVPVELRLAGRPGLAERVVGVLAEARVLPPEDGTAAELVANPLGAPVLLVGRGPPETPLHGAMVLLHAHAATACSLHVRARDARHVFLLTHRLLAGLPQHTTLRAVRRRGGHDDHADPGTPALARALAKALAAELRALTLAVPETETDRRLPRASIHALEVASDAAALALSARG